MCIIQNIWCKVTQNIGFFVTLHAFIFKPNFYKMKKFYLLSILAAASMTLQAAVFTSPGNGETWTMTKLAAQEEAPVTVDETGKVFTVAENVTISAGDTFQMVVAVIGILVRSMAMHTQKMNFLFIMIFLFILQR